MCGIAGFLLSDGNPGNFDFAEVSREMGNAITHRGPDDSGEWFDGDSGIALAHRRLSIIDLSATGAQPMKSSNSRYVIVFNGEIYNFKELRENLEQRGHRFRGNSDTEIALACISEFGLEPALDSFVGMFAFALWDKSKRELTLARDRVGEKPLYYGKARGLFVFGSELKVFKKIPGWNPEINRRALGLLMQHTYIPAPHSIYEGINKLLPGTWVTVSREGIGPIRKYWDALELSRNAENNRNTDTDDAAITGLQQHLRNSISRQMVADVSVGAFLSGGIDSSAVVSVMQEMTAKKVRTFSIGFNEAKYNEAEYAKQIANYLGTEHTEFYVTPRDALDVIPKLPSMYDEPFSDSSQIPTYLVSALTRNHVTVALSGDAGDELFGGYTRYRQGDESWIKTQNAAKQSRGPLNGLLPYLPINAANSFLSKFSRYSSNPWFNGRLKRGAERILNQKDETQFSIYRQLMSLWSQPEEIVLGFDGTDLLLALEDDIGHFSSFYEKMMFTDFLTYLPDDILVKVDRASMATSLEVRVPMLDHHLVEFAWRLPANMKVRDGEDKWILRQVLDRYLPREMVERPKMGFGVPIDEWLRGELRDWAEDLLDPIKLKEQGFFNVAPIRIKWEQHLDNTISWHYVLWPVLMFQAWLEDNG